MLLTRMRLENFSGFADTGWIDFKPGINLIVGQNNAGKSALLRALTSAFDVNQHRSLDVYEAERLKQPDLSLDVDMDGSELGSAIAQNSEFFWPIPDNQATNAASIAETLFHKSHYILKFRRIPGNSLFAREYPSHGQFSGGQGASLRFARQNGQIKFIEVVNNRNDTSAALAERVWSENLFYLTAQRLSLGICGISDVTRLTQNASNLASVLSHLQADRHAIYERLVSFVRQIFPSVGYISLKTRGTSQVEILLSPVESPDRPEFNFRLDESGTGVAQVIAILAAVMTLEKSIIVIDEINSFLHPAATKSLLAILQHHFYNHQYIISTHSPEVISASNPSTVNLVRRDGFDSIIDSISIDNIAELKSLSDHLGISISDIFSADRMLWVEGPTEELCIPYLCRETGVDIPPGMVISSVVATGDFITKSRTREIIFQIYERLTIHTLPLVKSLAFSFDREELNESDVRSLSKRANGRVRFLPRRHLECYLIDPRSIAEFINYRISDHGEPVTEAQVTEWVSKNGGHSRFKGKDVWSGDMRTESWLSKVDAANLIKALCGELTDQKLSFAKKNDTLGLMKFVVRNNPGQLAGLVKYLRELVALASRD